MSRITEPEGRLPLMAKWTMDDSQMVSASRDSQPNVSATSSVPDLKYPLLERILLIDITKSLFVIYIHSICSVEGGV